MIKKFMTNVSIILLIGSCGKKSDSTSAITQIEQQQELAGSYKAVLRPLNSAISGWIPYGNAEIKVSAGVLTIVTYLDDDQKVTHIQSIHEGKRCPDLTMDKNADGFIDMIEAKATIGNVLIPLDGDLSEQDLGRESYPQGGSFTYTKETSLEKLLADLYSTDLNPNDHFIKLKSEQPFNIEGKVILIHGTADTNKIPISLQAHDGLSRSISVPIVCGVIRRINN